MTHNYTGYTNHGCRCEVCTAANREHNRKLWDGMKARRADCTHRRYRSNGPKYEVCCRCGVSRKKLPSVDSVAA